MPTTQAQLQAQAHAEDIKKLQEDLQRLEDLWRLKEDVSRKENKKPLSLLAIILGVVIVPCIALSINNTNRLNEYDRAFEQLEKLTKHIYGLNEIKKDVPILKETLTDVKERIGTIKTFIPSAKQDIESIRKELKSMNSIDKRVKDIESSVSSINNSYSELKNLSDFQREQWKKLNTSIEATISQIVTLQQNATETDSKVAPAIQQQKELFKEIMDSNERMIKINTTVHIFTFSLYDATKKIRDIEPKLTIVDEAATKMEAMQTDVYTLEAEIENVRSAMSTMNFATEEAEKKISKMSTDVEKLKTDVTFYEEILKTLQYEQSAVYNTLAAFPWMSVVSVVDVLFVLVVIVVYLNNHHWNVEHSENDLPQNPNGNGHERRQGNVRPQSILDRIHRVPVLDNKVCVLSFYSETMNLHKQLVESALATSRRGNNIIQHLVRRPEDILTIPSARYIFVFVDFSVHNVILEDPRQHLGDKKLVTVQAAQRIGAEVFVTYVRDRGSNQLLPGNLYNQELSAFTSHLVLRGLERNQRCFSVYETFNSTQKESIVRAIS